MRHVVTTAFGGSQPALCWARSPTQDRPSVRPSPENHHAAKHHWLLEEPALCWLTCIKSSPVDTVPQPRVDRRLGSSPVPRQPCAARQIARAISPTGRISAAAPISAASRGIPYTTEVSSS